MFNYNKKIKEKTDSDYITGLSFDKIQEMIIEDDNNLWKEHLRLRNQFEILDIDPLSHIAIPSIEDAYRQGFKTISGVLKEFEKQGRISFSPSHGIGHAIRDYLHSIILAKEDTDPREAYVRIVAGTFHDILGCSFIERFDENNRSLRHAEASALIFWYFGRKNGMRKEEILPIYYAIAAHTNYLKSMQIKDNKGRIRKIEPYKKDSMNGQPIYFLHAVQEVDRLDIISPCGFFRHCFSIQEAIGCKFYFSLTKQFFTMNFEKHLRPLLRPEEEIKKDIFGATARELLFAMADTQKDSNVYTFLDGKKMIEMRNFYRDMMLHILSAFDVPIGLSVLERSRFLFELNDFFIEKIEPTKEATEAVYRFQKMFITLPVEIQEAWFSAFATALKEYEIWRENFIKEIADLPEYMLNVPLLGDVKRIV